MKVIGFLQKYRSPIFAEQLSFMLLGIVIAVLRTASLRIYSNLFLYTMQKSRPFGQLFLAEMKRFEL